MKIESIRRIAAKILNCGQSKVWIDYAQLAKIKEAITTEDIKALIKDGIIKKKKENAQSKGRARLLQIQKRKGRKKGPGKRKGTQKTRTKPRLAWIKRVRALRRILRELRKKGRVKEGSYKRFYKLIKGNYFKGRKQLEEAVKENLGNAIGEKE